MILRFYGVYKYCKYIKYTEILFFILNLSSMFTGGVITKTTRQSLKLDACIVDFYLFQYTYYCYIKYRT